MSNPLVNFIAAQLGWLACVWSAAKARPEWGVAVALVIIGMHLASVPVRRREALLLLLAACFGAIFDSLMVSAGWLQYASGTIVEGAAPYWLIVMWSLFATTLNVSLGWLKGRPLAAAILGGVFGPLAYRAGAALGAVEFVQPLPAYVALGIGWAIAMPLLMAAAQRLTGTTTTLVSAKPALGAQSHV